MRAAASTEQRMVKGDERQLFLTPGGEEAVPLHLLQCRQKAAALVTVNSLQDGPGGQLLGLLNGGSVSPVAG